MTSGSGALDLTADIRSYFHHAVELALDDSGRRTSHSTEAYLVSLLVAFARPDASLSQVLDRSLTVQLAEAWELGGLDRFQGLREVGDVALYVDGFFGEHIESRGVARSYVRSLGARAYWETAATLRRLTSASPKTPVVFEELAEEFDDFASIVQRVAERAQGQAAHTPKAILELYERWLHTRSPTLASELTSKGLLPKASPPGVH